MGSPMAGDGLIIIRTTITGITAILAIGTITTGWRPTITTTTLTATTPSTTVIATMSALRWATATPVVATVRETMTIQPNTATTTTTTGTPRSPLLQPLSTKSIARFQPVTPPPVALPDKRGQPQVPHPLPGPTWSEANHPK